MSSDPYREPGERDEYEETEQPHCENCEGVDPAIEKLRQSIMESQYLGIYRG